ncbi:uncharacterized protein LOC122302823 [Carya illinoinensis]|uniref:DUF4378 domain-containing protein n=1 Tax=Carya illinoinensis TaxID=32201 RepID=A0A8T1QZW8_CARIL|nr:uncharacterized protein LOC122302823 [Carya illinoinensis]KAG6659817.1 hypothetical protein CIPAW_03G062700 [Carya illinoinensis]KAG6659819.1 hypothetical protein CIPAW_03G062700 [Carya illinoinensis]KAG6659820.1 hypothetical protein CIPAW_03G062700 [Carya illinoinensis]
MNENPGKASSCLAITTEKRTHRPGGCVGIFFQLFDWNRRFAKKKLFSRKLLPPVRAKQASKKFKGDEKMPISKLHLIADENSGGFPNVKKNGNRRVDFDKKHEMRAPGLVARLMGLESMPAVHRDRPKKPSFTDSYVNGEEKVMASPSRFDKGELNLGKGGTKQESRPQKLQKTGPFEGRAVTRFGAEALQIKSVLSRSRKHHNHHPKLASPLKGPRISSGRNVSRSSRLIGAATRILEPGLQATSRAKCTLSYSSSVHHSPTDEIETERMSFMSLDSSKQSNYNAGSAQHLMGQASCKNCGNLVAYEPNVGENPSAFFASNFVNASTRDSGWSKPRAPESSHEQEREVAFHRSKDQDVPLAAKSKESLRIHYEPIAERLPLSQEGQRQLHLSSQTCKPKKDESSSVVFKHMMQTEDRMLLGRDRIPPRAKVSNLQGQRVSSAGNTVAATKDFVALNRSLTGRTRLKLPTKVDNSRLDAGKKACNGRDGSLPQLRTPVRKRRTINFSGQTESPGFVSSTIAKGRNICTDASTGKSMRLNAHSMNQNGVSSRLTGQGDEERTNGNKETDIISFTFNSPVRHKTVVPTKMEERIRIRHEDESLSFQKALPLRRDALGILLEQKLKELTCQEDNELTKGAPAKTSSAMILQELISAMTAGQPCFQDGHIFNNDIAFETKAEMEGLVGSSCQIHHLSPGSVLEASFSSSSLDESPVPGHRLCPNSMDYSYNQLQPREFDTDLLDSATSSDKERTDCGMVADFVRNVTKILDTMNLTGDGLMGITVSQAKEVILNSELLFGGASPHTLDGMKGFLVSPCLLDELESFARAAWTNYIGFIGLEDTKEGNYLRRLLFDMVIECLDSKYGRYCNSGFKTWSRLPLCMSRDKLILDVAEEVRRWTDLVGMIPDEIIEWEMGHSLGKWTDFHIEVFETGAQIDGDILQFLVEEIVMDLLDGRSGPF